MADREILIGMIEVFFCEREGRLRQLDRWECHYLLRAIGCVGTPTEAQLGVGLMKKVRVPESRRLPDEVAAIPKTEPHLTMAEARASFEEAISRPLRAL